MTTNHKYYLDLAFKIAEINLGKTKLNPSVGTIIVKNNSVISTGVTSLGGKPHAEFNALKKNNNFKGASLYTTLEPCCHYGLTPPCVNIIIKNEIKNVYYSFEDPDKRTFKKAKKIDWETEYLDKIISVKLVDGIQQDIDHINQYSSGHTESIITENNEIFKKFYQQINSAIILQNA